MGHFESERLAPYEHQLLLFADPAASGLIFTKVIVEIPRFWASHDIATHHRKQFDRVAATRRTVTADSDSSLAIIEQPLSRLGDTGFIVCANHPFRGGLYFARGVSHGYGQTYGLQHFQIVRRIANSCYL